MARDLFRLKRCTIVLALFLTLSIFQGRSTVFAQSSSNESAESEQPYFEAGELIYTDIDTSGNQVYVLLSSELWKYDLSGDSWTLLRSFDSFPEPLLELDFGYDPFNDRLMLWSRGVGVVYELSLDDYSLERIDRSFSHNNQFGHFPFFREGELHAFGGYGFWEHKSILSFFNSNILEWNIVSVASSSTLPEPRTPHNGTYVEEEDVLYIYGGTGSENDRPDDKNMVKSEMNDIWKFNFGTASWQKIGQLEGQDWTPFKASISSKIRSINSVSKSFFSSKTGNWYRPLRKEKEPEGIYYVKPFNIKNESSFDPVEMPLGDSKDFIISNFHFNPKKAEVVLIGIDRLTNTSTFPLRVKTISEELLLADLRSSESDEQRTFIIGSVLALAGVLMIMILVLKRGITGFQTSNEEGLRKEQLLGMDGLNESELKMIEAFCGLDTFYETNDLEEAIWSEVDNYDYRRKLRNETIKSINEKFREAFDIADDLIIRRRDPDDHRRLHYGLNKDLFAG
jgi:hypothetical protein